MFQNEFSNRNTLRNYKVFYKFSYKSEVYVFNSSFKVVKTDGVAVVAYKDLLLTNEERKNWQVALDKTIKHFTEEEFRLFVSLYKKK